MNNYSNRTQKVRENIKTTAIILTVLVILNRLGYFFLKYVAPSGNAIITILWETIVGAVVIAAAVALIFSASFIIYVSIEYIIKRRK